MIKIKGITETHLSKQYMVLNKGNNATGTGYNKNYNYRRNSGVLKKNAFCNIRSMYHTILTYRYRYSGVTGCRAVV